MPLKNFIPFNQVDKSKNNVIAKSLDSEEYNLLSKVMKISALALGFQGASYFYSTRAAFEPAPYDFVRIMQAADTDGYVKQAFSKYKELFWKEGWKIIGENQEAVNYLYERIAYMELAMKRPFLDFLNEVSDQFFKFSNVFIVKARGDISRYFSKELEPINAAEPIVGYYLIPTEQVRIERDKNNKPEKYQQATDPLTYSPTKKDPTWSADKVIHLYYDKKPGRAFGTPFVTSALDDVIALRQIEEDIQNLVHRELFPMYHYQIGTPEQPAEPDEITQAVQDIENMRAEGGLVTPHRHNIKVVGAEGASLDASNYLEHFKERVALGLGLFPHHLGMMMNGGNRSVTDRLDVALYDKIKHYQKLFSELIRVHILNELLMEGGFDPMINPLDSSTSDRCYFKFNEIDVDTQVKKESHIIQKFANNAITLPEVRIELGLDPEYDYDELLISINGRMQMEMTAQSQAAAQDQSKVVDPKIDGDKQASAKKGQRNLPNTKRGVGNTVRPANQQGRNDSPNIRRTDSDLLNVVESLLKDQDIVIYTKDESEGS